MSANVNQLALGAAADPCLREDLIGAHEGLILRTAAVVSRRYVSKSDDEWSVALGAFSRAVDAYAPEKGDFLPFAQLLIRRALVDYFRTQRRYRQELAVAPHVLAGEGAPDEDPEGAYSAVVRESRERSEGALREEIEAANAALLRYGFRFYDLADCSPAQERTRRECAAAIRCLLADAALFGELERSRKLPMRALAARSGVSKKTLDRYRKYLIMAATVLRGDYPLLAEYLKFVKEGNA